MSNGTNPGAPKIPVKDQGGNVIGEVVAYEFDAKAQAISATVELADGTALDANVPVGDA